MATDMYIQRGWQPPQRRSFGPLVAAVAGIMILLLAVAFGIRALRHRSAPTEEPAPAAPAAQVPAVTSSVPAAASVPAQLRTPRTPAPATPAPATPVPAPRPAVTRTPAPPPAAPATPAVTAKATASAAVRPSGPDPAAPVFEQAKQLHAAGDMVAARDKLYAALDAAKTPELRRQIEDLLGTVNTAVIFSPLPMAEKIDYTIQRGDVLAVLARKNGTTVELLQKGNLLKGAMIRPGDRLKILKGTFSVAVDKSDNELVLSLNGRFFKRYRVGTGKFMKTPTGTFKITDRIAQPPWWRDGQPVPYGHPDNVLGTHWLALDIKGYGIHGTWEPDSIGKHESAGCIRLLNSDIEELFSLLPVGTEVVIQD